VQTASENRAPIWAGNETRQRREITVEALHIILSLRCGEQKRQNAEAMKELSQADAAKRLNPLEIITLILSIYVLIALLIQALLPLAPDAVALLERLI
jgi:hypothetical protein